MNTTVNKALIAVIGGGVILINTFFNTGLVVDETMVNSIAAVLTPLLVYFVPNKGA